MSEDNNENNNENGGEETPRPRRGRPPQPRTETINSLEAKLAKILEDIENQPNVKARTIEEIVEFNKSLMTRLQDVLMEDLKTVSVKNIIRVNTPNGPQKQELVGLPATTREYLLKLYDHCNKVLTLAEASKQEGEIDPDKKFAALADQLYRGIPGLKVAKN